MSYIVPKQYSVVEMQRFAAKRTLCKTCQYRAPNFRLNCCDYILITGVSRGCDAEDCKRYVKGPRIGEEWNKEI